MLILRAKKSFALKKITFHRCIYFSRTIWMYNYPVKVHLKLFFKSNTLVTRFLALAICERDFSVYISCSVLGNMCGCQWDNL